MGVIEVEVPECLHIKPLKEKIDALVREEEARWLLFERSIEELNLTEAELGELEEVREQVWKEENGLVVDTNIFVSVLIKDHSKNAELIKTRYFKVYFPEYGLIELKRSNENTGDMAIDSSIKTKEIKDD